MSETKPKKPSTAAEMVKYYYDAPRGTKFDEDREAGEKYWLGPVVKTYEIAEYGFIEYEETDFNNGPNYSKQTGNTRFSIYINGHKLGTSAASLDQALVIAVAYKRDGHNTQMATFFWKATQPREEQ